MFKFGSTCLLWNVLTSRECPVLNEAGLAIRKLVEAFICLYSLPNNILTLATLRQPNKKRRLKHASELPEYGQQIYVGAVIAEC
uniref:Uncharacterized protein n=1 Tax=Arundo donax TaxID=35708 RepID=A0A0A9VAD2_ARUDO